jgi:hypothetical protein
MRRSRRSWIPRHLLRSATTISRVSSEFSSCRILRCTLIFSGAVSPPIATSPVCSSSSAPPFVLRPSRSRVLAIWWVVLHLLLLATVAAVGVWVPAKLALAAVCAVHAWRRWPKATQTPIVVSAGGRWSVPGLALAELELANGTAYAPFSVRLVLTDGRRRIELLLVRDQLRDADWRVLRAHLSRASIRI